MKCLALMFLTAGGVPAIFSIISIAIVSTLNGSFHSIDLPFVLFFAGVAGFIGLFLSFLIIFPAFAALSYYRWLNVCTVLIVSIIVSTPPVLVLRYFEQGAGKEQIDIVSLLWVAAPAIFNTFAIWLLWRSLSSSEVRAQASV
jgi:hypothetical protein